MAIDVCAEYDLWLAAEDFVPVLLAGVGTFTLAALVRRSLPKVGNAAGVGATLIVLGGLSKASWKLLVAGPCAEIPLLEQALFPFLATGFMILAWSMLSLVRGRPAAWWSFAVVLGLGVAGAVAAGSTKPLLAVAALGALAVAAYGIRLAQRHHDRLTIGLFVFYAVATFVLPPLAAQPDQALALQWGEQLTNTVAQAAFAYAAWRLLRSSATDTTTVPNRTMEALS